WAAPASAEVAPGRRLRAAVPGARVTRAAASRWHCDGRRADRGGCGGWILVPSSPGTTPTMSRRRRSRRATGRRRRARPRTPPSRRRRVGRDAEPAVARDASPRRRDRAPARLQLRCAAVALRRRNRAGRARDRRASRTRHPFRSEPRLDPDPGGVANRADPGLRLTPGPSDLQELLFLVLEHLVDLFDRRVRDLLEVLLGPVEVVLRAVAVLLERFEVVARLAPDVAHRDPALLGPVAHDLHEIAAPFLGQRREHEPYDLSVVGGVDAEVAGLDRLLDRLHRTLVVRRDDQHARLRHGDAGELLERHFGAVGVDLELLDEARGRAPGADPSELLLQVRDGLP